jgi:hypothetical protein
MENASLVAVEQQNELATKTKLPKNSTAIKKKAPSYQDILTKIQQQSLDRDKILSQAEEDIIAIGNSEKFTTLLQADKEKAKKIIDSLVSSAKQMTSTISDSLTSTPVHPYEKLLHEYLGPNHKPNSIEQYSIPEDFNFFSYTKKLRIVSESNHQLQMTQMAVLSAEAFNSTFDGTFDTENLNNAFAEPVATPDGKQEFVINETRLKEHLEFIEMVKNIPKDYILKNPLEVAKKMISEFVRIHFPDRDIQIDEETGVPSFAMNEILNNPIEVTKHLFQNYHKLNGADDTFNDFAAFIKSFDQATIKR